MPRPEHITSAFQPDELGPFYQHVATQVFHPRDWTRDERWRVVLHNTSCPRLAGDGICKCDLVDIKMLKRKRNTP